MFSFSLRVNSTALSNVCNATFDRTWTDVSIEWHENWIGTEQTRRSADTRSLHSSREILRDISSCIHQVDSPAVLWVLQNTICEKCRVTNANLLFNCTTFVVCFRIVLAIFYVSILLLNALFYTYFIHILYI